ATHWYDIPGLEIWKWFNLLLFVSALIFVLRRPLGSAFQKRSETIIAELTRAKKERDAALEKLKSIEARIASSESEAQRIREEAKLEAAEERRRIEHSTEEEIERLSQQAQREIERTVKAARLEMRQYAAEQSVLLAEQMIRQGIRPEDETHLFNEFLLEVESEVEGEVKVGGVRQ
ncbi:MAG: hypothetical protein ACRD63_00295, partial [Pyrinomonadaceae bacterium]